MSSMMTPTIQEAAQSHRDVIGGVVFSFLDVGTLLSLEYTCRSFLECTRLAWKSHDDRLGQLERRSPFPKSNKDAATMGLKSSTSTVAAIKRQHGNHESIDFSAIKVRVCRHYKAMKQARRFVKGHRNHFCYPKNTYPIPHRLTRFPKSRCRACQDFPTLKTAVLMPTHIHKYDFFVHVGDSTKRIMESGVGYFVARPFHEPLPQGSVGSLKHRSLRLPIFTDADHANYFRESSLTSLEVTVVAVEKEMPHRCHLLLATCVDGNFEPIGSSRWVDDVKIQSMTQDIMFNASSNNGNDNSEHHRMLVLATRYSDSHPNLVAYNHGAISKIRSVIMIPNSSGRNNDDNNDEDASSSASVLHLTLYA